MGSGRKSAVSRRKVERAHAPSRFPPFSVRGVDCVPSDCPDTIARALGGASPLPAQGVWWSEGAGRQGPVVGGLVRHAAACIPAVLHLVVRAPGARRRATALPRSLVAGPLLVW